MHLYSFLQFLFLNWSYSHGDFCDIANKIKCFRVDITLTPGMWASSNIYHIQNSVHVIPSVAQFLISKRNLWSPF
jgi:hypothetical protein